MDLGVARGAGRAHPRLPHAQPLRARRAAGSIRARRRDRPGGAPHRHQRPELPRGGRGGRQSTWCSRSRSRAGALERALARATARDEALRARSSCSCSLASAAPTALAAALLVRRARRARRPARRARHRRLARARARRSPRPSRAASRARVGELRARRARDRARPVRHQVASRRRNELGELAYTFNHMSRELASYDRENRRLIAALEQRLPRHASAASPRPSTRRTPTPVATRSAWRSWRVEIGRELGLDARAAPGARVRRAPARHRKDRHPRRRSSRKRGPARRRRAASSSATTRRSAPRSSPASSSSGSPSRRCGSHHERWDGARLSGRARRRGDPARRTHREHRGHLGRVHLAPAVPGRHPGRPGRGDPRGPEGHADGPRGCTTRSSRCCTAAATSRPRGPPRDRRPSQHRVLAQNSRRRKLRRMAKRLLACLAAAAALSPVARAEDPTARGFDADPTRQALSLDGGFTTETAATAPKGTRRRSAPSSTTRTGSSSCRAAPPGTSSSSPGSRSTCSRAGRSGGSSSPRSSRWSSSSSRTSPS